MLAYSRPHRAGRGNRDDRGARRGVPCSACRRWRSGRHAVAEDDGGPRAAGRPTSRAARVPQAAQRRRPALGRPREGAALPDADRDRSYRAQHKPRPNSPGQVHRPMLAALTMRRVVRPPRARRRWLGWRQAAAQPVEQPVAVRRFLPCERCARTTIVAARVRRSRRRPSRSAGLVLGRADARASGGHADRGGCGRAAVAVGQGRAYDEAWGRRRVGRWRRRSRLSGGRRRGGPCRPS